MNYYIWNIVTGNAPWMESTNQFPESYLARPINWFMRAVMSLMVLFLYGRYFNVSYRNRDHVTMKWENFRYVSKYVFTHDAIMVHNGHYLGSDW